MIEDVGVVEDGVEPEPTRSSRNNQNWLLVVSGFVVGFGLGVLAVGLSPEELAPPTTATGAISSPTVQPTPVEEQGVSRLVLGFPDTLIAVARTTGSTLDHLLWPREGELRTRPMAGGDDVRLDRSGRFIALSESVPGREGLLLKMGRFNQINPVAEDVTSYAWHDSASGDLAYTAESDGVWRLFVVRSSFTPQLIAESTEPGARLIGVGDWGWAVQTSPGEMSLLNPEGTFRDVESGVGYASHPDGWIFVMDERPKLVSAGGGVMRIDADLDIGTISRASISPDRSKISVAGERGWAIVDVASASVVEPPGLRALSLAWSSNSRFAVKGGAGGVVVYDTEIDEYYFLLQNDIVLGVGTAPLSDS